MQSLSDDEQRIVLGEILADKLTVIEEYLQDIPIIKKDLDEVKQSVNKLSNKFDVLEHIVQDHEIDIRMLKRKIA